MLWVLVQVLVLMGNGFDFNTAVIDAAVTQVLTAISGYAINTSMHAYQPSGRNSIYVILQTLILAGVAVGIQRFALLNWQGDSPEYTAFMEKSLILRFSFVWLMLILIAVLTWSWVYISDNAASEQRKEAAARLAREAELTNLRQQLQPHFLFNSLNSISALVGSQPEQARKMIQQLSDFLRGTLRKDDAALVSLEEELHHVQLYLEIEKVRFGHRLNTRMNIGAETLPAQVPSLILQPLLENAIKFGLYDTTGPITITLTSRMEHQQLVVDIKNPFDSETATPRKGTGFGLTSVNRRLYLLFSRNDLLAASREANEFIATLRIPQAL